MKQYLLDKILPAVIVGLIVAAINLYIDVQIMKKQFAQFEKIYWDMVEQTNEQLQRK